MKAALSAVAVAAVLALAPLAGGTYAAADDSGQQHSRFSPEDRAAFLDARIAALKAGLELNADQEKNWPPSNRRCAISRKNAPPGSPPGGRGVRMLTTTRPTKS